MFILNQKGARLAIEANAVCGIEFVSAETAFRHSSMNKSFHFSVMNAIVMNCPNILRTVKNSEKFDDD